MPIDKSLAEYYAELRSIETPANKFKRELKEVTQMTEGTVENWCYGKYPNRNFQQIVANYLDTPVNILFPPKSSKSNINALDNGAAQN